MRGANTLLEIILAMGLASVFTLAFTQLTLGAQESGKRGQNQTEAAAFARQGLEAVRSIARQQFDDLVIGTHGVGVMSNRYVLSGSLNTTGLYSRTITIATVQRDVNGSIVAAGGTLDYDTRLATSTVQWNEGMLPRQVQLRTYVTNWRKIIPAGLTVQKLVINHGGAKGTADFAPYMVGTGTVTLGTAVTLDPGTYLVSETVDPNYTQTFSGDCSASGSVTLVSRDAKTCTITNEEKRATITVNKTVINHGSANDASHFAPYTVGATTVTLGVPTIMDAGTYTVAETTDANYTQTFSGDCDVNGSVTLTPGSAKVCTITNEEQQATTGTVTVHKTVINHGSANDASHFAPYTVGGTAVTLDVATSFNPGTYTVAETTDPNYTQTFSGDCDAAGQVTVTAGTAKVCTITNEENITGGLVVYGNGTTTPQYRMYNNGTSLFAAPLPTVAGGNGASFVLRTSPTKREAVAGYVTGAGVLQILCFDGTTWTNEWSTTVGGTAATRRFDIAYETTTGNVMVLYSRNVTTTNELGYRRKTGSSGCGAANWTTETTLDPVRTSGVVHWVKIASDRRASSNLLTAIWADANADLSAMTWSGTAWGNEPTAVTEASLEIVAVAQDVEDFDVEYESVSGDVMVVWANAAGSSGTNGVRYRTCNGGVAACTWGAVTTPPTFRDDATNLDISANPSSDEIVFASIGNAGSNMQIGYWNGSAWTNTARTDTSCTTPYAGSKKVATGWLQSGATTRSIVVYDDQGAGNVGWFVGNGSTFTKQTDFTPTPSFANNQGTYEIQMDPLNANQLIFMVSDSANDLFAEKLTMTATPAFTWTNADGGVALETALPQTFNAPFSFSFWKQ